MIERVLLAIGRAVLVIIGSAAIASLLVIWAMLIVNGPPSAGDGGIDALFEGLFLMLLVSTPAVAVGLLVFGLPVDFFLHQLGVRHVLAYAASGAAGGALLAAIISAGMRESLWILLIFATYGLVTASLYWFFFTRRRTRVA